MTDPVNGKAGAAPDQMSPPACQEPRLDPESVTSGLGRGSYDLWLAWMAETLALILTICTHAIVFAYLKLGTGFFIPQ